MICCFAFLQIKHLMNKGPPFKERIFSFGSTLFPFRVTHFQKGGKNPFDSRLPLKCFYSSYAMNTADGMTHKSSRKHAYNDPLKPHFYIVKLGFTGVYIIFLISAQNIDYGTH